MYDLKPLAPVAVLLALYGLFMPATGSPSLWSLALHQQAIAVSALPTIAGSLYWFQKANELGNAKTPEEKILNDDR